MALAMDKIIHYAVGSIDTGDWKMENEQREQILSLKISEILADKSVKTSLKFEIGANDGLANQLKFLADYGISKGYILTCVYHNVAVFTCKSAFKLD